MRTIGLMLSGLLLLGNVANLAEPSPFDYDKKVPFSATAEPYKEGEGFKALKIKFMGQRELVPAILFLPTGLKSKPPVILLLHGMGGNKSQMDMFAALAVQNGYATFALDAPLHGERSKAGRLIIESDLKKTRDNWVEAIVDYRRAIDYLESRSDIDSKRILLLGVSMGGMMGSVITGADKRVKAATLIIAGGDYEKLASKSIHPIIPLLRRSMETAGKEKTQEYLNEIDGVNWIGKVTPRPLLFVNGLTDPIMPKACAEALIVAAKQPKTIIWDPVGHTIAPTTIPKIIEWLKNNTPGK